MQSTGYYLNNLLIIEISSIKEHELFMLYLNQVKDYLNNKDLTMVMINYYNNSNISYGINNVNIKNIINNNKCYKSFIFSYPVNCNQNFDILQIDGIIFLKHLINYIN